jgi:L-alanine-DL-glutamate epimerase-like enolase superfamily enzyme
MASYDRVGELPLVIDDYALRPLREDVSSGFTRNTTVFALRGAGHTGLGEDVSYDSEDQSALQAAGASLPLTGSWTIDSFSQHLDGLSLWPEEARHAASIDYRRWAYESAALDLALRQAGTSLHALLGRKPQALNFVVSLRLSSSPEQPSSSAPLLNLLKRYPTLRFKLDPTEDWDEQLISELVATGAVDSVDFKAFYVGTVVDQHAGPELYERVIAAFPDAWIEDPAINDDTEAVLSGHHDRITWDAPIHSVADIEALPFPPRMVNIKPSRFGPLSRLFAAYDHCEAHGIGAYGGGQFELGVGRGQIQYLASIFHPDSPNEIGRAHV